jgi:hypothetical protein
MNDTNSMMDHAERDFEERCGCNIVLAVIGLTLLLFFAICVHHNDCYPLISLFYYDEFGGSVKDIFTGYVLPIAGVLCVVGGLRGANNVAEKYAEIEDIVSDEQLEMK